MVPRIVWQKWLDPFDEKGAENSLNLANEHEYFPPEPKNMSGDLFEEERSLLDEERVMHQLQQAQRMNVIMTPMGMVPITEYNKPSANFNFWVFHTNFNVSPKVIKAIKTTVGVETLDIFTRYRGRIGIGQSFKSETVKLNVQKAAIRAHRRKFTGYLKIGKI